MQALLAGLEEEEGESTTEGEATAVAAAFVQRVCQALIAATADERVGVRAHAIWAIGNVAQGLLGPVPLSSSSQPQQLPAARLCAAALALLQAHPQQEKTASSAIRALGFLAGELEEGHKELQAACLAALLGAIDGGGAGGDKGGEEEEPTARVKTRWNACCALAWVLARLNTRGGGGQEAAATAAPPGTVRTLVHTLMADGNAKVRAHAAAALQAVGSSRGAYCASRLGADGGNDEEEEEEGEGRQGFVAAVEAAVEVERWVRFRMRACAG